MPRCSSASCSSSSRLVCCRGRASALRRGWDWRRSSRCCWEPPVPRSRCGASPRSCSPARALRRRSIRPASWSYEAPTAWSAIPCTSAQGLRWRARRFSTSRVVDPVFLIESSWEVHVRHGHQGPMLCGIGKIPLPTGRRRRRIHVELDRDVWIIELNVRDVNDVAPEDDLFAAALENVVGLTGSVAVGRDGAQPREQERLAIEGLHASGGDIRSYGRLNRLEETPGRLWSVFFGGLVGPIRQLPLVQMHDRVRKYFLTPNRQPAGVIRVNVGHENIGDLFRGVTCVLQALGELEKLRTEESSGPRVHKNQALPQVNEERVHRRF